MKLTRDHRSLTAWVLYASILFSLFACGIHHGQMSGLQLSGLDWQFCSTSSTADAFAVGDLGDAPGDGGTLGAFSCPLCSSIALSIALLFGLSWLLRLSGKPPYFAQVRSKAPPRYTWPSANPRASPSF